MGIPNIEQFCVTHSRCTCTVKVFLLEESYIKESANWGRNIKILRYDNSLKYITFELIVIDINAMLIIDLCLETMSLTLKSRFLCW